MVAALSLAQLLTGLSALPVSPALPAGGPVHDALGWLNRYRLVIAVVGALSTPLFWLLGAAVVHLIARALRGRGRYTQYLLLAGYLQGLALLAVPFSLLAGGLALAGLRRSADAMAGVAFMAQMGLVTARVVLEIIAARIVYQLGNTKATIAVLAPYTLAAVGIVGLLTWATLLLLAG